MPNLKRVDIDQLDLDPNRIQRLQARMNAAVETRAVPGISLAIARDGGAATLCAGRRGTEAEAPPVTPETVFLVASVTKPVVAAAVMLLVERGQLALDQPAAEALPEFGEQGKGTVTIRHLLTHTSGLPDMLPENQALREERAPLAEFVRRVCRLELEFPPGTRIQYQSMGSAVLGAIVERVEGRSLPQFLKEEFFQPLAMEASCLGFEPRLSDRLSRLDLSTPGTGSDVGGRDTDWGWNSDYWRGFGAPWGGMFSTPLDLCRLLELFEGDWFKDHSGTGTEGEPALAPPTVRAMTRSQTDELPALPEAERRRQSWGLGWRLNRGPAEFPFGDLLSPDAFGHAGATGTMVWHDPRTRLSAAIFSSRPLAQSRMLLHQCSSLIAAAGVDP